MNNNEIEEAVGNMIRLNMSRVRIVKFIRDYKEEQEEYQNQVISIKDAIDMMDNIANSIGYQRKQVDEYYSYQYGALYQWQPLQKKK
jgi:methyl-accepting chemotaxis protein